MNKFYVIFLINNLERNLINESGFFSLFYERIVVLEICSKLKQSF